MAENINREREIVENRQKAVKKLGDFLVVSGDQTSAGQLLVLTQIQEASRRSGALNPDQVTILVNLLNGPVDELVKCRALATFVVPLQKNQVSVEDRTRIDAVVRRCFKDRSWGVRHGACSLIAKIGTEADIQVLLPLANDPEERVRQHVVTVIQHLRNKRP